ncbi:trehalose operon repressor [Xylocopilactobacillus apicola]|uniref:Trehalose operon repressor n=1 Tax=Xylocopilactobacillus apicola TaxID=2932184 RepID=A0AAU9DB84_9LACO|nr:trehalose operon repressor [Xylocopilactobacillus apicola]BDR59666.1 trehalose operon repressor [Xylocopilactobacillus apicola]
MEKYLLIYTEVLKSLRTQQFMPGDLLPSDKRYSMKYQVSRETVRKAMKLLANDGYIQRLRGKGSVVIDRRHFQFPISEIESYSEVVKDSGLVSENIVLEICDSMVPEIFTPVNDQVKATKLSRMRVIHGERSIIDHDYILQDKVAEIPREWAKISLFGYLEEVLNFKIDYAVKTLTVEKSNSFDQLHLSVSPEMPMVVIRSRTHLTDNSIISYTESRHRADRFSSVVFARRHGY